MFGVPAIDDNPGRLKALRAAAEAALPSYQHKRGYRRDFSEHELQELKAGVIQLITGEESNFSQQIGMEARGGTLSIALICQFLVDESDDGLQVEQRELLIGEEFKSFVRAGVKGMSLELVTIVTSAQQMTPYGFVVAHINAGPPRSNTN
jgi:hypothetical protein